MLIERGINLNATIKSVEWNALHLLCTFYRGHNLKPLVEYLIDRGIDPDARTNDGFSFRTSAFPLLCQSYRGNDLKQVMELLISKENATNPSALMTLSQIYSGDDLQDLLQTGIDKSASLRLMRLIMTDGTPCTTCAAATKETI